MAFEFDEGTAFEGHKGSDPGPRKRKSGRTARTARPEPEPGEIRVSPDTAPAVVPNPGPPARKPGLPRTGKYPIRDWAKPKSAPQNKTWARSNRWVNKFFSAYKRTGILSLAADIAGISIGTVKNRRRDDTAFAARLEECHEWFVDYVESEVCRRALEGDEAFTIDRKTGDMISLGKKPDNILLMFLMKKLRPDFRENYKPEDRSGTQAAVQVIANFLHQGMVQATLPGDLPAPVACGAIEGPAETRSQRLARLRAELARAESETADGDP